MSSTETRCPYPDCGEPLSSFEVMCPKCKREILHCPTCGAQITPGTAVCNTCGVRKTGGMPPSVDNRLALLADSYRLAALNDVNMPAMADAIGPVRAAVLGDKNRFRIWTSIKDQIGQFRGEGINQVLNELRFRYLQFMLRTSVAEIDAALSQSPERGWIAWLIQLAEALSEWSIAFFLALARWPFNFEYSNQADQERIRHWARFVEMEQWAETLPLFEFLSEHSQLAPSLRGPCLRVAAEIHLFHLDAQDKSKELIERFEALAPEDKEAFTVWSEYWLKKKDYPRALDYAERAIEHNPSSSGGYNAKGDVLLERGDPPDQVEEMYRQALHAEPGDTNAHIGMIRLYARPGLFATRKDTIDLLVKQGSAIEPLSRYDLCLEAADAFLQNSEYEQAHDWYRQAIHLDPTRPSGYLNESFAYIEHEKWDTAREILQMAHQVAPQVFQPYWDLGWWHEMKEEWAEARHWYEAGRDYRPQWRSRIESKMAEMQWKLGELDEAEQALYSTLGGDPDSQFPLDSLEDLATEHKDRGNPDAARRIYENILKIRENSFPASFFNRKANLDYEQGDYQQASEGYRRAIASDPNQAVYHSNLALASRELRQWDLARREIQRAFDLDGREDAFHADMALIENAEGNALFSQEKYREAADKFRRAIEFTPKDAVLHSNLADALENQKTPGHRAEELREAVSVMQQAFELAPESSKTDYKAQIERRHDLLKLVERYAEATPDLLHDVTPIVLEIESALVADDTRTQRWVLFTDYIPGMRKDILSRMGLEVPHIRVRQNDSLGRGEYSIQLDEVPIAGGTTWPGLGFTCASREKLAGHGIPEESLVSAFDPLSGKPACWVNPNQYGAVKALGLEIETDPLVFVINHLESVLLQNIGDFATFQNISFLVDTWTKDSRAALLISADLSDEEARLRLWQLLKTLLRQRVPVTAYSDILEAARETGLANIEAAVRQARLRLKPHLPGNGPNTRRIALAPEQEAALEACRRNGDTPAFVRAEFEVLSAIRSMVQPYERNVVLVVEQAKLAPLLRELLQVELPYAAVLTREEVLSREDIEFGVEKSPASAQGN